MNRDDQINHLRVRPSDPWVIIDVDRSLRGRELVFWCPACAGYTSKRSEIGIYLDHELDENPEYFGRPAILVVPSALGLAAQAGKHDDVPWAKLLDAARSGRRSLRLLARIVDDALDRREVALDRREAELDRVDTQVVRSPGGRVIGLGTVTELKPSPPRRWAQLDERESQLDRREETLERRGLLVRGD